jgi:heat shock protein HtpX
MTPLDLDARTNERRTLFIVVAVALPAGLVAGLVGLFVGLVVSLALLVGVTALIAGWLWFTADVRVARLVGGEAADPIRHARFVNMVDGVCSAVGVTSPRLLVIEDNALNTLAAGRKRQRAILAVTSGLLEGLDPIELEGILAEQLVRIRRRDILPLTVALPLGGLGLRLVNAPDDTAIDLAAVSVTRYPPGLAAALETMNAGGTALATNPKVLGPLWLADPYPVPEGYEAVALVTRAEALREL